MEPFLPGGHHVLPHLHLLVLVHVLERDVAGDAAADDPLRAPPGFDHGVDGALLVSDEHDLRRVRVTSVTRPTRPWPLTTASYTRTPSPLPALIVTVEYQALVERSITRAVTSVTSLGNTWSFWNWSSARSWSFSALRGELLGKPGAQLLDLLLERLVLRLGAEEVADPVPGVAEGLGHRRGAALERRDHGEHGALHAVRDAAVGLAEVRGEQGDGQQQQDCHDDPPPEYAPAIHRSAKGGTTGRAAGSCACS